LASPENERERGCEEREALLREASEDWRERAMCDSRLVSGDGASSSSLFRNNEKKGFKGCRQQACVCAPVTPP
jgi:hypothetical protein